MARKRVRAARPKRRLRPRLPRVPRAWLPGALTMGNLLGGYAAILASAEGKYALAAIFIVAAAVFDALDGRVARLTGATSEMGMELDSLCDAVSFGVAPSILVFHMGIASLGRGGYAVCFLFAACGVLRLARFNILPPDPYHFTGLPIPLGAAAIITPVLLTRGEAIPDAWIPPYAGFIVLVAFLMVSRIRYRSFKDLQFRQKAQWLLPMWAAILAGLVWKYEWVLPGLIVFYLVSPALFAMTDRMTARTRPPLERPLHPRREPAGERDRHPARTDDVVP